LLRRHSSSDDRSPPVTIEAIRHCLRELDPSNRQLVQGRYAHGLSASQIAEMMKFSAANVRQKLVRIRMQLKRCVQIRLREET
jgi:RNA polymerase sigma-70 factor (ECF subfamily)